MYYLVKWCSLPYEDSTWELKDDVDQSKIEEFEQLQAVKPDSRRMVSNAHPHFSLFTALSFTFISHSLFVLYLLLVFPSANNEVPLKKSFGGVYMLHPPQTSC